MKRFLVVLRLAVAIGIVYFVAGCRTFVGGTGLERGEPEGEAPSLDRKVEALETEVKPGKEQSVTTPIEPVIVPETKKEPAKPAPISPAVTVGAGARFTREMYEKLKQDMSYKEVVEILGAEGKQLSTMRYLDGSTINTYQWQNDGKSVCFVTFRNDKVISKMEKHLP